MKLDKEKILKYAVAYSTWVISLLLWVWFMFLARDAITSNLALYYYQDKFQRGKEIQFISQAWMFSTGIIWLIIMVVVENYLRVGVNKKDFIKRIGKVIAPEVLLIFLADLGLAFAQGLGQLPILRWLILLLELGAGIGLTWLAIKGWKQTPQQTSGSPS